MKVNELKGFLKTKKELSRVLYLVAGLVVGATSLAPLSVRAVGVISISNCTQLQSMNDDLTADYQLTSHIDCSESSTWNSGEGFVPVGSLLGYFQGSLEGNGWIISNLTINTPASAQPVGLFGVAGATADIHDFTLANVNFTGLNYVGAVAGILAGSVTNVRASGQVTGSDYVGGLVGYHSPEEGIGSSSPLVYTWNGTTYDYQTDVGRGIPRNKTGEDSAQLDGDVLVPKDGKYSMKISQEYDEIVYFDELALKTYDTTPGYQVANSVARDSRDDVYTISKTPSSAAQSCVDMYGNDCLASVVAIDDNWTYRDERTNINTWEVNFGDLSSASRRLLVLKGARDYTLESSEALRYVQVKNSEGQWVDAYSSSQLSSFAGSPRTEVLDMTDKFLTDDYTVKIGMDKTKFSYIAMDTSEQQAYTENTYHPESVDLRFNGYTAVDKTNYWDHDYNSVKPYPSEAFSSPSGNFTKYGSATPLLQNTDDKFVVMHHGDMMDISFDYQPVPEGKERSYVLYNWATFKHSDNNAWSHTVEPLPFNGMSKYPYDAPEKYPDDEDHQNYLSTWNTRSIVGTNYEGSHTIIDSSSSVDVTGDEYVGGLVGSDNGKTITGSHASGDIVGSYDVGGLVGSASGSTIENSYAIGDASSQDGSNAGGLVGSIYGSTISDSFATGDVSGYEYIGGLIGYGDDNNISYVYATGDIVGVARLGGLIGSYESSTSPLSHAYATGDVSSNGASLGWGLGGLIGVAQYATFDNVYATGDVTLNSDDNYGGVGGLVGNLTLLDMEISNAYATGNVTASGTTDPVYVGGTGGLIGNVNSANVTITQTYATGNVENGKYTGGLIGDIRGGGTLTVSNSYSKGNVTGDSIIGGVIGRIYITQDDTAVSVVDVYSTGLMTPLSGEMDTGSGIGLSSISGVGSTLTVRNIFWDSETTGNYDNGPGSGRTTSQMKNIRNYVDSTFNAELTDPVYDFTDTQYEDVGADDIWTIDSTTNDGYPYFSNGVEMDFSSFSNLDGDELTDNLEDLGPNDGDANDDGTQDILQKNVGSLTNSVSSHPMVLEVQESCKIVLFSSMPEEYNNVSDSGYEYPVGMMDFYIECDTVGATITVSQYYYNLSSDNLTLRKYDALNNSYQTIDGAVFTETTIGGQNVTKITYQITDGGELDQDGVANGIIIDPSGPGYNNVGAPNTGLRRVDK